MDIRIHPSKDSKTILLLIPGVDGSVDGFENKYVTIAEANQKKHCVAVVRISNPFISSFHWESNVRHILDYIEVNKKEVCGNETYDLYIQAHSAGASVAAVIAYKYDAIKRLLLINIAMGLNTAGIIEGIKRFSGEVTLLIGDKDPSLQSAKQIQFSETSQNAQIVIAKNADHDFSGDSFPIFLEAANKYLFKGSS